VTRPILGHSPLRAVGFGEVIGLGKRRLRFEQLLPMALNDEHASEHFHIGLSPHSPYTLEPDAIQQCVQIAQQRGLPLAIHLAETTDEEQFIRTHAGPLREMWDRLGSWTDFPGVFQGTAVEFAKSLGLLDRPSLLAHVNYCSEADLALLARGRASVVYCPRTHKYFQHPPHRWRDMLATGINVAVGTDSCASSPDLNLVDELRLLHQIAPQHPVDELWKMATLNAARAVQWESEIGSIAKGKSADFTVFRAESGDPLREILQDPHRLPVQTWIKGNPVSPC
jgi:cytosine/adenosine deaminase-related metal-dependent hydrolase